MKAIRNDWHEDETPQLAQPSAWKVLAERPRDDAPTRQKRRSKRKCDRHGMAELLAALRKVDDQ